MWSCTILCHIIFILSSIVFRLLCSGVAGFHFDFLQRLLPLKTTSADPTDEHPDMQQTCILSLPCIDVSTKISLRSKIIVYNISFNWRAIWTCFNGSFFRVKSTKLLVKVVFSPRQSFTTIMFVHTVLHFLAYAFSSDFTVWKCIFHWYCLSRYIWFIFQWVNKWVCFLWKITT